MGLRCNIQKLRKGSLQSQEENISTENIYIFFLTGA